MAKYYKGFNQDMTCRGGFQFAEGQTYHEDNAELCKCGFHACENPLDCYKFYGPGKSVYHEVELNDVCGSNDEKVCAKTIKIGAKLDVAGICKAHFDFVKSKCESKKERVAGDRESAAAGDCGSAAAGYRGSAAAGNCGSAAAGGNGMAAALNGRVRGDIGCCICASEYDADYWNVSCACAIVDGVNIKADTWYRCVGGELVEVSEE